MRITAYMIFIILTVAGHYFAWQLILKAWPQLKIKKYYILIGLALISFIFVASFALLHIVESSFLAMVYTIFAVLFGLLTQLMLFGFLFFIRSILVTKIACLKAKCIFPNTKKVAQSFIVIVVVFFLLGTYNAFFPRVKTINLDSDKISSIGEETSFVHLSDIHLGAIYRPFYLERIAKQVNKLKADYIIISGDLFDGSDMQLEEFIPALKSFLAPVIFVPGNHDVYILEKEILTTTESAGIFTLSDEAIIIDDVEIIGFNYVSHGDSNIRRVIDNLQVNKDNYRIVVNHVPVDHAEALALEADLMLSGHSHRGQIFPFSLVTNWIYGKYAYGLENYENMLVYTSAGTGTWGPPLRTLLPGEIILFKF